MGDLINRKKRRGGFDDPPGPARQKTELVCVRGVRYANAAAKFWPNLFDEIMDEFPECTSFEMSASSGEQLGRIHLHPEDTLSRDLESIGACDIEAAFKQALSEFEMFGPPSPVQVRIFSGSEVVATQNLPLDCVDSETFSFLLVWPLEWAGVAHWRWNDVHLSGEVSAEDPGRRKSYKMVFSLSSRHLSEGLYTRSIVIAHTVQSC